MEHFLFDGYDSTVINLLTILLTYSIARMVMLRILRKHVMRQLLQVTGRAVVNSSKCHGDGSMNLNAMEANISNGINSVLAKSLNGNLR